MTLTESVVVSRKTPADGKLEVSPALAGALGGSGTSCSVRIAGRVERGSVVVMPCTCEKAGRSDNHEHHFVVCEAFRERTPGETLRLHAEPARLSITRPVTIADLPGGDLIERGMLDLQNGLETVPALLVSIGAPKLRLLGYEVPQTTISEPEHTLYALLAREDQDAAHGRYNALVRRLVSFEQAAARANSTESSSS